MALRVVVVERDSAARRQLRNHLESVGGVQVVGEAADQGDLGGPRSPRADAVFVGIPEGPGADGELDGLARLAQHLPGVSMVVMGPGDSAELVLQALRAGAVEFLCRPVSKADVAAAVEKLKSLRPSASAPAREPGRITAVYASKGGLGVTTLATNLAVCLAQRAPGDTLLVDLDLAQSGVATFLNLQATYSVVDAFGHVDRLDEAFLRDLLVRHPSGVLVLAAPPRVSRFDFAGEEVAKGLGIIRGLLGHTILDLPHDLDPGTAAALEAADEVLYLVGLNVPALRASAASLTALKQAGIEQSKIRIVVARANAREEVNLKGVREALGLPVFWHTPSDYPTVVASLNEGQPLVLVAPKSEVARNVRHLVDRLSRNGSGTGDGNRWLPGIFRRVLPQGA